MSPAESRPGPFALLDGLEGSRLAANVMHFGRILRAAGLPVGTGKVLDAVGASDRRGVVGTPVVDDQDLDGVESGHGSRECGTPSSMRFCMRR